MFMSRPVLLALVCLCFSCGSVLANDLITTFRVVDCNHMPVNATVRISGCVDYPIYVSTNANGIAVTDYGLNKSIQYCFGSADYNCTFEVVTPAGTYSPQSLVLPNNTTSVTPKEYICQEYGCCHPCNQTGPTKIPGAQEPSCTNNLTVTDTIVFVPPPASCQPPPPGFNLSRETCFAFIPPLSPVGSGEVISEKVRISRLVAGGENPGVVSVSLRDNQQNDVANGITLTSGMYALNQSPLPPFETLTKVNRWGWEQLFSSPLTTTGTMYCGQNKPGGNITVNFDGQTLTYSINMPGTPFSAGDVHVFAGCSPWPDKAVAPGQFNCNPSKPSSACGFMPLSSSSNSYSASMNLAACGGSVFTMFHLGL